MDNLHFADLDLSKVPDFNNMTQYSYWSLKNTSLEDHYYIKNIFNEKECSEIIKLGNAFKKDESKTGDGVGFSDIRKSMNSWIPPCELTYWIYERVQSATEAVNKFYEYDLNFMEQLQFTEYSNEYSGYYDKHVDKFQKESFPGNTRKLSFSVQLSNPDSYEGGDLILYNGGKEPLKVQKDKGIINFFPSHVLHEVTPVTKGFRYSLVSWVSGPKFR